MKVDKIYKDEPAIEQQVRKDEKLVGKMRLKRGHKLFEVNRHTHETKEAVYEAQASFDLHKNEIKRKLVVNPECVYVPALNAKNALLKFYKINAKR